MGPFYKTESLFVGICRKYGLPFKTEEREFEDDVEAELFILRNQRARRNLPTYTLAEIGFEIEKRLNRHHGNRHTCKEIPRMVPHGTEANRDPEKEPLRKAAKSAGMGHNTYAKCKYIDKHGTEELKQALRKRETSSTLGATAQSSRGMDTL